ncbi:hypothetical protein KIPE111705_30640 [Kibdelosporangium persicum]|uniref:DUF4352 domain-containing protein n=1 Tax=Kibdelosporangium persicum TaxID=2698649 RepID=A0ABX2F257_9PSEU|nr:hypothetical protein [Kibdelosporangium persicum]NRN64963.1 hypothetical protein [Kibdelosporangium persicum]
MNRLAALAVPAALLALGLSGCGSKQDGATPPPVQNQPGSSSQPTGAPGNTAAQEDTSAASDVKITKCVNKTYGQDVTLEVTNSTPLPQRYVVGVNIKDANGGTSEARFAKNRMEPGQTVTQDIPGDTPLKGEVTCEIGEAKRLAPK